MSPNRRTSLLLTMISTATVLAITAAYLAVPVGAMATGRTSALPVDPGDPVHHGDRIEREAVNEGLLINECCSKGKILNEKLECEDVEKKDKLDLIANSIAVDESLNPAKVNSYQLLPSQHYRHICSGDKFEVVYWPKDGQPKTHYINHKSGELLLVKNETIAKTFSPITYCVDEAKKDGKLMYAMMMCPCTVTTCIQKCCPEGEYFDTVNNKCEPLNPNISGFQPQLHHMKNESSKNTHYYLTEGNPQCGNQLRLEMNVTKAYPQESGWLMVDDVEAERYQFYERGKYCLDTFYDATTNKSSAGGWLCKDADKSYVYEETVSKSDLVEIEPPSDRLTRRFEQIKDVLGIESPDEASGSDEDVNEDAPEVEIRSFDSKAGAGTIKALWDIVGILFVVVLYEKLHAFV